MGKFYLNLMMFRKMAKLTRFALVTYQPQQNTMQMNQIREFSPKNTIGPNPNDLVGLKIQGLPFQIHEKDIIAFFSKFSPVLNSVHFDRNKDGRRSGYGALLFQSSDECLNAMNEM